MPNSSARPPTSPSDRRARRPLPLGHLRAAVLCGDDQLRRPAGHRHPQADAPEGVRLERDRLRRHRLRVPARLRDRVPARRPDDRLARDEEGLHRRARRLEPGRDGARRSDGLRPGRRGDPLARGAHLHGVGCRIHLRAARARVRRGGKLSGRDQSRRRSGSRRRSARSPPGLFNSGTNIGAVVTPLVVPWITLYWGWYWAFVITGALGFLWLFFWIPLYRCAGAPPVGRRGRARAHPQRPARPAGAHPVDPAAEVSADVGVRARQVPHRPGVVAVPLLDSGFSQPQPRDRSQHDRAAARRDLSSSPTSAASAAAGCRRRCSSAAGASTRAARRPCWCARWPCVPMVFASNAHRSCGSPSRS